MASDKKSDIPQSIESEKGLLGSMIIGGPIVVGEVYNRIRFDQEEWFFVQGHRTIYKALIEQWQDGVPIDQVTLSSALSDQGLLDQAGGRANVTHLALFVPASVNWPAYLEELSDKRWLRIAAEIGQDIKTRAIQNQDDVEGTLQSVEHDLMRLTQRHASASKRRSIGELSANVIENLEDPEKALGISTGYSKLDDLVGGYAPHAKIVIAGATSGGKSALAANLAKSLAVDRAVSTLVFTFEMGMVQWVQRIIQIHAGISARRVIGRNVDMFDVQRFAASASAVGKSNLVVTDERLDIAGIRARVMQVKPRVVIIDYIQIIPEAKQRGENTTDKLDRMSSETKQMAHQMGITVIELSQLTYDERSDTHKTRGSKGITNDADQLWVLEGPDDEDKDIIDKDIAVAKQREGGRRKVHFRFEKPCTKFTEKGQK